MAKERNLRVAHTSENATDDQDTTKEDLQRQMEETRQSISQTVTEIKDSVVDQYESVKDTVTETLDWREQFRKNPIVWCFGALSVGYVIGNSVAGAFRRTGDRDELLEHLAALGDRFADELSRRGMDILVPALTGTVLVPVLVSKLNEMTGMDFSDLAGQLAGQDHTNRNDGSQKAGKKGAGKKSGKKKHKNH